MNEKWKNRDLKLVAEKKCTSGENASDEEWTKHVSDLQEGEEIKWMSYSGFYRTPYGGDHAYHFTFLGAGDTIRMKAGRKGEEIITLDDDNEWTSGWYEEDGWLYRVKLCTIASLYAVSELPDGVRTMQQQDHDAWEYAVRNGLI